MSKLRELVILPMAMNLNFSAIYGLSAGVFGKKQSPIFSIFPVLISKNQDR